MSQQIPSSSPLATRPPSASRSRTASGPGTGRGVSLLAACAAALVLAACQGNERSVDEAAASEAEGPAAGAEAPAPSSAGEGAGSASWAGSLDEWYPSLDGATRSELEEVRAATAGWTSPEGAMRDGYLLFWASPSGDMVRYVDGSVVGEDGASALDGEVERTRPEVLVYTRAPGGGGGSGWRLAAVEYALPKTEAGSTRPPAARQLFTGLGSARWREHPTRQTLGMNVKWSGHGECHYEGGAEIALAEGPGYTFVRLPPGAMTGESWDGPPVTADDCAPVHQSQDLLLVHGKWWVLRAWIGQRNPGGVFQRSNPDV